MFGRSPCVTSLQSLSPLNRWSGCNGPTRKSDWYPPCVLRMAPPKSMIMYQLHLGGTMDKAEQTLISCIWVDINPNQRVDIAHFGLLSTLMQLSSTRRPWVHIINAFSCFWITRAQQNVAQHRRKQIKPLHLMETHIMFQGTSIVYMYVHCG